MAPKVYVPADFGRHHIGAPSHGNLSFNLQEGLTIKANSIILSLNSPVIDELTTNQHLTSLEAEDFSREAVDCFIEASYTGEVEALNQSNFRDVNKMSVVFKVNWLVDKCEEFFISYLDRLDSESASYSDLLFAVEEAVYLMSVMKKRYFLPSVVKKMNKISNLRRDGFVNQYLSDLTAVSSLQIDACIAIVCSDVHVLVEILINHLEEGDKVIFDEGSRFLFKNLDLKLCHKKRPEIHQKLFSILKTVENIDSDDYKFLLEQLEENTVQNQATALSTVAMATFAPFMAPSNLGDVIDMLVQSSMVENLYQLIDGIWTRTYQCFDDVIDASVIEKLVAVKIDKGWRSVEYEYVNKMFAHSNASSRFVQMLKSCDKLVSKRPKRYATLMEYSAEEFVEAIFNRDNSMFFRIDDHEFADMEFVLFTTAMKELDPDTFSMRWAAFSKGPFKKLPQLHFAVERLKGSEWSNLFPITWLGKPTCETTRTSWSWGCVFYQPDDSSDFASTLSDLIVGKDELVKWGKRIELLNYEDRKYRFVAFEV